MSLAARTHLITAGLLGLAVLCYALGAVFPGGIMLLIGGVFELAFWFRMIGRRGKQAAPPEADQ